MSLFIIFKIILFIAVLALPMNFHAIKDYYLGTVGICSALHTTLPPWDWDPDFVRIGLADFPSAQKAIRAIFNNRYYKLMIYIIGYLALNGRSTLWASSISIKRQMADALNQFTPNTPNAPQEKRG